jgi:hypothetical protein
MRRPWQSFDRVIFFVFAAFLFNSIVVNIYLLFGDISSDSASPIARQLYWYGSHIDPLSLHPPTWLRFSLTMGMVPFTAYYIAGIVAFRRRAEWIRTWTLLYGAGAIYEVVQFLAVSLIDQAPGTNVPALLAINIAWLLVPVALIWRVWRTPVFPAA